ncbi:MAG: UDP-glucose 4-epimerase GalE [Ruminococcaceae bacterium]|nr:UDP-glucose 4-epimerase GalE [Oscillospiraceae bacterium]
MAVLITGGTGFIGSHATVEFLNAGYDVVIVDNLSNSNPKVLDRIKQITGHDVKFYRADVLDRDALDRIFEENPDIDSCIHFAGLKAVGESVKKPLDYYTNNVMGTVTLLESMRVHGIKTIVFSSSATVYGVPDSVPIKEDAKIGHASSPYGETKIVIEKILEAVHASDSEWSISILRYFNPIGAHESGLIGEDPKGIPNNLLPYVAKVALGKLPVLNIFGNDYNTHDGTGVRDYIHVVDLAKAHLCALEYIKNSQKIEKFNIGTGNGCSVLDVVRAYEQASGVKINYRICERRPGDIDSYYSDPTRAREVLGWCAKYDLLRMCADAHNWQTKNPDGYTE